MPRFRPALAATLLALTLAGTLAPPAQSALPASLDWGASPAGPAPCPEGQSRVESLYSQGYESAIPESRFSSNFTRSTSSLTPEGGAFARGALGGSGTAWTFLPYVAGSSGTTTYLAFGSRATGAAGTSRVSVNSVTATLPTGGAWKGTVLDVTAATRDEGGWLGTWFEHKATSGSSTYLDVDNVQLFTCRGNATHRYGGADRYETAAQVARQFATGRTAYVASGTNFPDALSAAALAGATDSPLLLTEPTSLPAATTSALTALKPSRIVVLGSTGAVSASVAQQLAGHAPVTRLGGADRYETSALISREFAAGTDYAFVATGLNFPDALAGAALAGALGAPVLLVPGTEVPQVVTDELKRLRPGTIVVLGGPGVVSSGVATQLAPLAQWGGVTRLAGADRYETAAQIGGWLGNPKSSFLATGTNFPDALAGAALAGSWSAPLLLTEPGSLSAPTRSRLVTLKETRGTVLGSPGAVSSLVRDQYGTTLP